MSTGRIHLNGGRGLHRFAVALAGGIVLLIAAGALVKSKEAGLAVPDWPLSYGSLNPPRWWQIENVRAEHGHRLIAGTVALLTLALALLARAREPRRWVRRLAWGAVGAVVLQALLGGVTVLLFLPAPVSVAHAGLAQLFLCMIVTLALVTSESWQRGDFTLHEGAERRRVAQLASVATAVIFVQILIGAVMRHTGAGLAIPDFPLAFGGLVPPRFDFAIAVHYLHRFGALVTTVLIAVVAWRVVRRFRQEKTLLYPAAAMGLLVACQVALGASVVWSGRAVAVNTAHVAVGALLLSSGVTLTLYSWRGVQVLEDGAAEAPPPRAEMVELSEVA